MHQLIRSICICISNMTILHTFNRFLSYSKNIDTSKCLTLKMKVKNLDHFQKEDYLNFLKRTRIQKKRNKNLMLLCETKIPDGG